MTKSAQVIAAVGAALVQGLRVGADGVCARARLVQARLEGSAYVRERPFRSAHGSILWPPHVQAAHEVPPFSRGRVTRNRCSTALNRL